ncbi:ribonuclease Z [Thermoplasma volcanium]|uniref:Ribonuclease Z n=1 Tax=Thermoplasma volcanium (strain ATCC 51530 / DSM 4299 / JCM 9571 / NBRC 15438 / GSS1) TaxID=273116 RepID=RNZ_THEVO|nr:ribonuclease Z [Thermoplasma volcanium]Q979A8.2 RecName: Full=Ribonuclease Z; Short=RNase Z; AltName: Full=tRNA 3 endonuclease; AltName: Full=tRNase Z [Thermoplasma volcanium GSS1]
MASNIKIVFFGTGGSWPTPIRAMPGVGIQIDDVFNLFDCGEGTQKQIMKSKWSFMSIDNIFITHFHGDHFLGLIGLVQSMSFNNRTKDLNIFGPRGAIGIISNAINIGYYTLRFRINVYELEPDKTYDLGKFLLKTTLNDHPVPALSYTIEEKDIIRVDPQKAKELGIPSKIIEKIRDNGTYEYRGRKYSIDEISGGIRKGRKIVYTGDTKPMQKMADFAKHADVLIHDTTTDSSFEPAVNQFGHSSAKQAARIARDAGVSRLFLYHYSPRITDVSPLVDDARAEFQESYASEDLMEYEVKVKH